MTMHKKEDAERSALVEFIRRQRSRGLADSYIAKVLRAAQWSSSDIATALTHPKSESTLYDIAAIDSALSTYVSDSLKAGKRHNLIINELIEHGWSVEAIQKILASMDYHSVLKEEDKNAFVRKHRSHFFSKAKKFSEGAGLQSQSEKLEPTTMSKELEALKEQFALKEKELKEKERAGKEELLAMKLDDIKRSLERQESTSAPSRTQTPQSAPSPVIKKEMSTSGNDALAAASQQAPIIVMKDSSSAVDALESKFADLVSQRGNFFAYTNPVIPEKLHLVSAPVGDRAPTGIPGLDPIIEGGLRRGTATLVGGGPGTGKSTLALQYLVQGAQKFNEPGIYISFEETKESIEELGMQFGWNLQQMESEKSLIVREYTPEQLDKILESGGGSLRDLIDSMSAKRIVIDSVTAFMLLYEGEIAQRRACLQLFRSLSKWGCTTIAIAEEQGSTGSHEASVLEYETSAVILLYNERKGDLRQRSLEIFKMRGTKHAGRIFPMRVDEHGVEVYPREAFK